MLENIPDFQYFLRHSFSIRNDKDGGKEISVRKIDFHPAINDCQVIKMRTQFNNDLPAIIHTDLTIERGSVTKKSYIKLKIYRLEGTHKIVYHARESDVFVVVRTDKYPLFWLYYWITLRAITSADIAKAFIKNAWQHWRIELEVTWRSLSGLFQLTHGMFKAMAKAIQQEWKR